MVAEPKLPHSSSFGCYSILTFDIYDTLIDGEAAIYKNVIESIRHFPEHHEWLKPEHRAHLMERFAFQEGVVLADHPEMSSLVVLEQAHYRLLAQTLHIEDMTLGHSRDFAGKFHDWPVVQDTRMAMHTLQRLGYKLIALSNWDPETVERVMSGNLSGLGITKMYTAQGVGSYRLDTKSLQALLAQVMEDYNVDNDEVLHIAHGAKGGQYSAERLGVAVASIARDASEGREANEVDGEIPNGETAKQATNSYFKSLEEFADACKKSFVITGGV